MNTNYWFVLLIFSLICSAQTNSEDVLFTINENSYSAEEFERVYKKNIELVKDQSQKDIDNYLELFISYKLKVLQAYELGLDQKPEYKNELATYRGQYAKKYLQDKKVTQELMEEAYNRMRLEVRASHILLLVDEFAAPADTLKAYNRLNELKKRAEKGEDFASLAISYSEDPSAKNNKGDLGYFSAFNMVYPFESNAYNTGIKSVSKPFRTKFGYHILKVEDVRPNRGQVEAAHIMLFKKKKDTSSFKPQDKIFDLYLKLKQGEKFEKLASMHSEDKGSAQKGGVIGVFGSGDVGSAVFEDQAFGLQKSGDYSKPFETKYGWHIIKLIKKIPFKSFEEQKNAIRFKVLKDDRSIIIKNTLTERLESKYKVVRDDRLYKEVVGLVNEKFYSKNWSTPMTYKNNDKVLFLIESEPVTVNAFLKYIYAQQNSNIKVKPVSRLVDFLYEKYKKEQLNLFYNKNLENEVPEFNYMMTEYKEGILLFDLMDDHVWAKAKKDTIGLKKFYHQHMTNYKWDERYDVKIISSTDEKTIKKAKKHLSKGKDDAYIKKSLNIDDAVMIMIEEGVYEKKSNKLPKKYVFKEGVSDIIKESGYYYVVFGKEYKPSSIKKLEEIKGQAISDYQEFLEDEWVKELKSKATIQVNQTILSKVKTNLQ